MYLEPTFNHPFDLRGLSAGDSFLGCKIRKWQLYPDCAAAGYSEHLNLFTVTQEDLDLMAKDPSYGVGDSDLEKIGYDGIQSLEAQVQSLTSKPSP